MDTKQTVSTDKQDYAPGATATIKAKGFSPGAAVEFKVGHVLDAGPDGVLGTSDDTPGDNSGNGHQAWRVTDGGEGDLDGVVDGNIQTSWFVDPDDSADATFLLSATGVAAGADGLMGTADDQLTGESATHSFTDSGGSYTLKWAAADPAANTGSYLSTYSKMTPAAYLAAGNAYPVGRATANTTNPLDQAVAYGPTYSTNNFDAVPSLAPKDMALGQIVPFFMQITVTGSTAPENGVITFTSEWLAKTSSGGNFGFDTNYKIVAAFVDARDAGHHDPSGTATVDSFSSVVLGAGGANERIEGTFQVSGLDLGDRVIVELWAVLKDTIPAGISGNVQTSVVLAHTGPVGAAGDTIPAGNQTVPLLRVQEFFSANADLAVVVSDSLNAASVPGDLTAGNDVDPANLNPGDTFTYTIRVANNSSDTTANTVLLTDTLSPYVTFVSASDSGVFADNGSAADTISWNLAALTPGQTRLVTVTVRINNDAPTGSIVADLSNSAIVTSITSDSVTSNNSNTESTNLNAPPLDGNESVKALEDTRIAGNVLSNGLNPDGGTLAVSSFTIDIGEGGQRSFSAGSNALIPGVGALVINSNGTYEFTPAVNYNAAVPVVTYTVIDGQGASDTSTLSISITPVVDGFADASESVVTLEDTAISGNVLTGTSSVDGPVAVGTFKLAGSATTYTAGQSAAIAGVGTLTINANGAYTFTPAANYNGPVPVASYTTTDGFTTNTSTLTISITPVIDGFADASESVATPEDTAISGNVLTGTSSVDGPVAVDTFKLAGSDTSYAAGQSAAIAGVGALTINANGAYTFTPAANYNGPVPVASYTTTDGFTTNSSTLTIAITPVVDGLQDADESLSTPRNVPLSGNLLAGTSSVDGPVTVTSFAVAGSGTSYTAGQSATIAGVGALNISGTGAFSFTPVSTYSGSVPVVTYIMTDGSSSDTSTLAITVTPVATAYADADESIVTLEDTSITGSVLNGTSSIDGVVTVSRFSLAGSTVSYTAGQTAVIAGVGSLVINTNGLYTFTPAANYNGAVPVATYTTTDGFSVDTSTLTIAVTPVADGFVDASESVTAKESAMLTGNVLSGTNSVDGVVAVSSFTLAGSSTIYTAGQSAQIPGVGVLTINTNGSYIFTPIQNYNGPAPTASYNMTDGVSVVSSTLKLAIAPSPYNSATIAPTGVSALQYLQGTAPDFSQFYAGQGGVVQYNGGQNGAVTGTNPGVFFYYTGLSNTIRGIDANNDKKPDLLKVLIDQSDNSNLFGAFAATQNDVKLFKVTDVNKNGIIDAADTLSQVQLSSGQIVLGAATGAAQGAGQGDVTVNFTPDAVGSLYIMSVQYATGAVTNTQVGSLRPTVRYDIKTDVVNVGAAGSYEETDLKGITLAPKLAALTLDGAAGDGARIVTDGEFTHVVKQAIAYWAEQGASGAGLAMLNATQVFIADLGGLTLAGVDAQGVWIDDDAAGHGWSVSNHVVPGRVDMLSALVHEFGHLLGHEHDEMDPDLAVGQRELPMQAADAGGAAHTAVVIGSHMALHDVSLL
ncbi:MAG: cadherin-like domain-containing protein [Telluria sp.]